MDTREFSDCLDRWGGDLENWPAAKGIAGRFLLDTSELASELLREAHRLDRWLAGARDHQAPMGLERRILEQIPYQDVVQRTVDWFSITPWRPALVATFTLLVGFAVGLALPDFDDDRLLNDMSMLAFSATYEELIDAQ